LRSAFASIWRMRSRVVGLIVLAYYIYLLYTAATDPRKQGFHDRQANTLVASKSA
jgi:uncharacterized RDD family membrane protein YckC